MRVFVLNIVGLFGLSSCAVSWTPLPSETYRGIVRNSVTGMPVENAEVVALRPKLKGWTFPFPVGDVEIGKTLSGKGGNFVLRTNEGYAKSMVARSADDKMAGQIKVSRRKSFLHIALVPAFRVIVYRSIDPRAADTRDAEMAIRQIMDDIIRHPDEILSLGEYERRKVISSKVLQMFENAPRHYFGPNAETTYVWGNDFILIPDVRQPIRLVPYSKKAGSNRCSG